MKNEIENSLKDKRFYYIVLAGLFFGLIAHLYGIVNIIRNHDSWDCMASYGAGVSSGRWGLSLLGNFIQKTYGTPNLSFFNGIIAIVLLILSSYYIIKIFDIKSPLLCVLWAGLFVGFPVVTSTMMYTFTVHYYALAVFLTVFSVYLSFKNKNKWWPLLSIFFGAFSLGIYQGYFPMMITLYLLILIKKSFTEKTSFKEIFLLGVKYVCSLILVLIFYYLILQLIMTIFSIELTTYKGINTMGRMTFSQFTNSIITAFTNFFYMPVNGIAHDISCTKFLSVLFILLFIFTFLYVGYIIYIKKDNIIINQYGIIFILLLMFPMAINSIVFMCHDYIHDLMIYSWVLFFIVPIILIDKININKNKHNPKVKKIYDKSVILIMSLILFGYLQDSNTNYTIINYANRQANNYWNSVVTSVKQTPGFNTKLNWAFIGNVQDELYFNPWQSQNNYQLTNSNIINIYSYPNFISENLGYNIPFVSEEEQKELGKDKNIINMPCYPDYGSIKIYDDKVIVKFSNEE